jgi:hypothetical protein
MAIRTIFTMAEDCAAGQRQGWFEFVRDYGTIARTLMAHYFPGLATDIHQHLKTAFVRANSEDNAWFRSLRFSNEREFAMEFRGFIFAYGRETDRIPLPVLSADALDRAQDSLTLLQRQLFWIYLRGWNAAQASAILISAPNTAQETKALADERIAGMLPAGSATDRFTVARVAIEVADGGKTADCLSWKTTNNIINGQIAWRERELAEIHMAGCIQCLNAFTAFQEMIWLRKSAEPLPEPEVANILKGLRLRAPKGLLSRLRAG